MWRVGEPFAFGRFGENLSIVMIVLGDHCSRIVWSSESGYTAATRILMSRYQDSKARSNLHLSTLCMIDGDLMLHFLVLICRIDF